MSEPEARSGYVIQEVIGRGAMGVVYRALAPDGWDVAIKMLLPELATDPEAVQQFIASSQIMAQLPHPFILSGHCIGALPDGRPYLVTELIKGPTVAELLRERPDPSVDRGRFVAVFEQVCEVVAHAHNRGVIHRDLEPSNVMISSSGYVRVIDWGLAKVVASRVIPDTGFGVTLVSAVTRIWRAARGLDRRPVLDRNPGVNTPGSPGPGAVLGTPAYMSPEQARGEVGRHDTRTDVSGLGGLLCHILTGRPPYTGSSADEVTRRAAIPDLGDAFARLDACGADVELISLCKRCLSPEPDNRPADGGEVAKALSGYRGAIEARIREAEMRRWEELRQLPPPEGGADAGLV